ncbi:MAG: hypothetical protein EAZ89_17565, partial [Bacteroidetes bacterium]
MLRSLCFRILFVLWSLLLAGTHLAAQQPVFSSERPAQLTVCDVSQTFSVKYINTGSNPLTGQNLSVSLPTGIVYEPGSLSYLGPYAVNAVNTINSSDLKFSAANLPAGDSVQFSIRISASMDAIAFLLAGNIFRNKVVLTYSGGSETHISQSIQIRYAALNILSITPSYITLKTGDSTSRSIKIVNAGNGRVSSFYLTDVRNPGLTIYSMSKGTLSATQDTVFFSGADFTSIGNGDTWFDTNEQLTLIQYVKASGCANATITSRLTPHWGCGATPRISSSSYCNISVAFKTPNLILSSTQALVSCFGGGAASAQTLTLNNAGEGRATTILLDLFKTSGSGYNQNIFSRIDTSSLRYRIGSSGPLVKIRASIVYATRNDGAYSCLGANPIGRVRLALPEIPSATSITIFFDMYHCCISGCNAEAVHGWGASVTYKDVCLIKSYSGSRTGQGNTELNMTLFTETPQDIQQGQTLPYYFTISSHDNNLPAGTGARYRVVFDIPSGLSWSGNSADLSWRSGIKTWTASSITFDAATRKLTALYPMPAPFVFEKSEFKLNLTGNCSNAQSSAQTIGMNVYYLPDAGCATCEVNMLCNKTVSTDLHCPGSGACVGMDFRSYGIRRVSFGRPDNNQDGLPETTGSLTMSQIRSNRAMVSDTLKGTFFGMVGTNAQHSSWSNGYAVSRIQQGVNLTSLNAELRVYDASAGLYRTCSQIPVLVTTNGTERSFAFDFSAATLANLSSSFSGFTFGQGDSVWLHTWYRVSGNLGGSVQEVTVNNDGFYLSHVPNPTLADRYQCERYNARFTLIGYFYNNAAVQNYNITTCSSIVQQNFYLSIGDCCDNYAGGNLFPYEYRNWAQVKRVRVVLPPHYEWVRAYMSQVRTRTTNSTTTQSITSVSLASQSGDTLYFNLSPYYKTAGGTLESGDDGFSGTFNLEIAPSCEVPVNTNQDIQWAFTFAPASRLGGGETAWVTSDPDKVRSNPTTLTLSS